MTTPPDQRPEIVTHRIPRIEVYQVTDDELTRIEDASNQVAQDLSFALAGASVCASFVIGLVTGSFSPRTGVTLTVAAVLSGLVALYTGIRWLTHRNRAPDAIQRIRSRRVDPETPAGR